jgi:hypothetical protein
MKDISQRLSTTLGAGLFLTLLASHATAGCGDMTSLQSPLHASAPPLLLRTLPSSAPKVTAEVGGESAPSVVGMWNIQYIAQGNASRNPPIPDGTMVDFGYSQWHSDGTEIMNSGGHTPATQNFCLGVWGKTGFLTYELNHFALSYDLTTQALTAYVNIREQITLSPSGDVYAGTFTIDVYDPKGDHVDYIAGNVNATRVTVDSKPF